VIPQGIEVFVAVEPVDMRLGFERLGGLVRERMEREPRSRALFVFFGKRRQTVKVLSWDGTGTVLWYKRLDRGLFEIPRPSTTGASSVVVSEAAFPLEITVGGFLIGTLLATHGTGRRPGVTAGLGGYQFRRERRGPRTHLPQRRPGPERRLTRWVGRRRSWLGARLARDGAKKSAVDPWTR
jgi:transposase